MLVVVGLGNPGAAYRKTRHNAGYMLVDGIAIGKYLPEVAIHHTGSRVLKRLFANKIMFHKASGPFVKVEGELYGKRFLLVKPTTYMNESGKAVAYLVRRRIIRDLSELLVVVDDINLATGRVRLREKGSDGGQKGLGNIIDSLGTREFARLRIGVGPKPPGEDLREYVLKSFHPDEKKKFEESLEDASLIVGAWLSGGIEEARSEFSRLAN